MKLTALKLSILGLALLTLGIAGYCRYFSPESGVVKTAAELPRYGKLTVGLTLSSPVVYLHEPATKRIFASAVGRRSAFESYIKESGARGAHYPRGLNAQEFAIEPAFRPSGTEVFIAIKGIEPDKRRVFLVVYEPSSDPEIGIIYIYVP